MEDGNVICGIQFRNVNFVLAKAARYEELPSLRRARLHDAVLFPHIALIIVIPENC